MITQMPRPNSSTVPATLTLAIAMLRKVEIWKPAEWRLFLRNAAANEIAYADSSMFLGEVVKARKRALPGHQKLYHPDRQEFMKDLIATLRYYRAIEQNGRMLND